MKTLKSREDIVSEFNEAMGQPLNQKFEPRLLVLRHDLLKEEMAEVSVEVSNILAQLMNGVAKEETVANLIKELCDLQYVLSGFAATFGIDLDKAFMEVHRSNMSKLGDDGKPIYREDGKVLKGKNYVAPDMTKFLP